MKTSLRRWCPLAAAAAFATLLPASPFVFLNSPSTYIALDMVCLEPTCGRSNQHRLHKSRRRCSSTLYGAVSRERQNNHLQNLQLRNAESSRKTKYGLLAKRDSNGADERNSESRAGLEEMNPEDAEISEEVFEEIEGSAPSTVWVLKQLLGINVFTYVLAGLIACFLGLNTILGPGWLGQRIGLEGTGTFTEISDQLPSNVNLNSQENLL